MAGAKDEVEIAKDGAPKTVRHLSPLRVAASGLRERSWLRQEREETLPKKHQKGKIFNVLCKTEKSCPR
jgi:hypothetical protein